MDNSPQIEKPIIFFDGVCHMCNSAVDFFMKADKKRLFLFAPLQGETARTMLPPLGDDAREWSMIMSMSAVSTTSPMPRWRSIAGWEEFGVCCRGCGLFPVFYGHPFIGLLLAIVISGLGRKSRVASRHQKNVSGFYREVIGSFSGR